MKKTWLLSSLLFMAGTHLAVAQGNIDTSIFPKPEQGMSQHIFNLPTQSQENRYLVEIVASKSMLVDCNNIMIQADIDHEDLRGWGYPYYEIDDVSKPASTMMACPDGSKSEKRIEIHMGKDALIRYNSKLPLVVYAPKDIEVGYRIWQTNGIIQGQK